MEIAIIIIVVVILLSAAGKKKPQKNESGPDDRQPRSDIQRAFMMSAEQPAPQRAAKTHAFASRPPRTAQTDTQTGTTADALETNPYAQIDLKTFHMENGGMPERTVKSAKRQKAALTLFENKNDFVRAVIYSEILTRRR